SASIQVHASDYPPFVGNAYSTFVLIELNPEMGTRFLDQFVAMLNRAFSRNGQDRYPFAQ
ncbi:MAG: hypothetical protein QF590_04890, partial [Dehalococcoidia bacterium]|nr:hypothetical protein [Dehalococcoidia bacterium]